MTDDRSDALNLPDPEAERIAADLLRKAAAMHGQVELAWATWSARIPNVDRRTMFLLKKAFEARWDARGGVENQP